MNAIEIKAKLVKYMSKNKGSYPFWGTITGKCEESGKLQAEVRRDMWANGEIVSGYRLSKTGRKMDAAYLACDLPQDQRK